MWPMPELWEWACPRIVGVLVSPRRNRVLFASVHLPKARARAENAAMNRIGD